MYRLHIGILSDHVGFISVYRKENIIIDDNGVQSGANVSC